MLRRALLPIALMNFVAVQHSRAERSPEPKGLAALAAAYQTGDFERARTFPTGELLKQSKVPDYVAYFGAQAALLSGKHDEAARRFADLGKRFPRFALRAKAGLADALWRSGKRAAAAKLYAELGKGNDKSLDQAVIHTRLAEAGVAAAANYRDVVINAPNHPLAAAALRALSKPLSNSEKIQRARNLIRDRAWKQAADELLAISDEEARGDRAEIDYVIGTALYKSRHAYDEAARRLLSAAPSLSADRRADALFHGARALSRADKDDDAIAGYKVLLDKAPTSKPAAEAAFLIGWLEFNRGRYASAMAPLEHMIRTYPSSQFAVDARWILGFSQWMLGNYDVAASHLGKLAERSGALIGGKGRYWLGRTQQQQGKRDLAVATYRKLVTDYPLTYYAQLARLRLRELGVELPPFGDGRNGTPPAWDAAGRDRLLDDSSFARPRELARAGLYAQAAEELRAVESDFIKRHTAARALPALMVLYAESQRFARPHRLAEGYAGAALRLDPHSNAAAQPWWDWMYPLAHREHIEKFGPLGDNPPYYLYTIMQKESAYDPNDVSYADAIGLLQMIPPTSRKVAKTIGIEYTDDLLYDPAGNIQLGAWYIGHLLQKFRGQIPIGAGSYNAGPKAMVKWLVQSGKRPLDEFVELCSYTQTREYMKKVVDIYSHYVWRYQHEDYLPSLVVNAEYLTDDGVDY